MSIRVKPDDVVVGSGTDMKTDERLVMVCLEGLHKTHWLDLTTAKTLANRLENQIRALEQRGAA
jgi:hypothetical protein